MSLFSFFQFLSFFFFFNDTATTQIYTLSLHDALPILPGLPRTDNALEQFYRRVKTEQRRITGRKRADAFVVRVRSEEHTSELQSRQYLVCRLLLEKKKKAHKVKGQN